MTNVYGVITNEVSDYINVLVRIAHIICKHPALCYTTICVKCIVLPGSPLFGLRSVSYSMKRTWLISFTFFNMYAALSRVH